MNPSEWKVSKIYAGGITLYQVYRIKDTGQIDHSGNREVYYTFENARAAAICAADLNTWED